MTSAKVWKYCEDNEPEYFFKVPAGKGERSILSHIECAESGFLGNFMWLLRCQKFNKDSDCHSEMN